MSWSEALTWKIEWDDRARKELRKLDSFVQGNPQLSASSHYGVKQPRVFGQSLSGDKAGLWRYRVGNYRIICKIEDDTLIVFVIGVGHRKEIYGTQN